MSVCFLPEKKRQKQFWDGQKYNMFWKRPDFLEASVSSFANRHRAFDQKVPKTTKKRLFCEVSV